MLNQLKTVLLLGALTGILLVLGFFIGGPAGLTVALIISIAMNFGSYFFSDKIVLVMYRAQEAKKSEFSDLHKMVGEIAKQAGIPKPRVYIIPTESSNAFATGRNPNHAVVACTQGIMNLLSKEELRGVLAHEIAHIKNRDILIQTVAATIAGVISYIAFMAKFAAIFGGGSDRENSGGNIIGLVLLAIITPIVALIIQLAISRSREYLADRTGAMIISNPAALASALEKLEKNAKTHPLTFGNKATSSLFIVNPFSAKGLIYLFSTHPPMNERVRLLKNMKM